MRKFWIALGIAVTTVILAGLVLLIIVVVQNPSFTEQPTPVILPTFILPPLDTETPVPSPLPAIVTPTLETAPTLAPTDIPNPYNYTVQAGDTYSGISQKVGINWQILALVNQVDGVSQTLQPGQVINIPNQLLIPTPTFTNGKQIIVVIGEQKVYAFENGSLVNTFIVSTGTPNDPTVLGNYYTEVKLRFTEMSGPGYDLPNVPFTMYFYEGYALHGTYWHHNFGTPMSHGCVNLQTPDAEWLYNWAPMGTLVTVIN